MSILGEKIILELNGISTFEIDSAPTPKKGIASTRSFGKLVTDIKEINEAISMHIVNSARKLRKQKSVCGYITLYIRSNKPDQNKILGFYSDALSIRLPYPTDNTAVMLKATLSQIPKIFIQGLGYKKVGVYLTDICQRDNINQSLFDNQDSDSEVKSDKLMGSIDKLNQKFGKEILRYAVEGFKRDWKVKSENMSPKYTTNWKDLKIIKI